MASVWFSSWIAHALLGLDRLVQALGPAAALEDAAGELVDDLDLAVDHRVVDVALVERLGLQRLDQVVDEVAVLGAVEVVDAEELLGLGDAALGDRRRSCASRRTRSRSRRRSPSWPAGPCPRASCRTPSAGELGELLVVVGGLLGRAGDDQRRARLVDQDVVDLVDDREVCVASGSPSSPYAAAVLDLLLERRAPCCRAGSRSRTRSSCRR